MTKRSTRGYSLVEVLIAMAILGTVLLSIMTLFVFGRRNVYSGRQMTRATSVATHILEDLNPMSPVDLMNNFEIAADTDVADNVVAGTTYEDSIVRKATDFTGTDPGLPYFTRWTALTTGERMTDGEITLIFVPLDMETAGDPTTAKRMLVRVVTEWNESTRRRHVFLDTIKLNRSVI